MPSSPSHHRRALRAATAGVAAMLAVSACGSSAPRSAAPAAADGTVVDATLTEYKIALSPTPTAAGTYTFVATNRGATVHALDVRGPGGDGATSDLSPGQSGRFTVRLASGTTTVLCPVGSHKELGMTLTLTLP